MTRANAAYAAAFGLALVTALALALLTFPDMAMYHMAADEGAYYRQASTIHTEGLRGFRKLADEYIADPIQQALPAPIRVAHIAFASVAIGVADSPRALSALSLICFTATVIVTFVFVWMEWNPFVAALAGTLAALSPLGLGLSRRALMDTDYALFMVLALLLLIRWLNARRASLLAGYAASLCVALLLKETAWLFVPFFAAAIVIGEHGRARSFALPIVVTTVLVPLAALLVLVATFGTSRLAQIVRISGQLNAVTPNAYLAAYGSGPWYEYFISFLLLSPVVALLFFLFCGAYLGRARWHLATTVLLAFFAYGIACLSLFPKNPRLVLPLDTVVRIGAALAVALVMERCRSLSRPLARAAGGALLAAAVVSDVLAFERYFVRLDIYDPVTFSLLERERMTPPSASWGTTRMADEYLELSIAFFRAHDYTAAIRASRSALLWRPNDATAYNNIGAALCEMGRWQDAVGALETALRIDPSLQRAQSNLAWAKGELARVRQ